jgi:cytoplasmic iron level regulating protein YaaA (DUF328/UPF0246 family)
MSVTMQEIKDEILSYFIWKANESQNCASIVINKDVLPFIPRREYNIKNYVDKELLYEANKSGFNYCEDLSDENQLVFIMK